MKVKSVKLKKFMAHDDSELKLPDAGVVVITGHNGSGKSSFMEGVATGIWNKTLRGSKPWREGTKGGAVQVTTDRVTSVRKRSKMEWKYNDQEPTKFESTTHAQKALIDEVGDYDVWRRTSVFSSSDVSHFTLATDAQRKRLIEQLLGLDRFDPAHAKAKEELKALQAEYEQLDRKMFEAKTRYKAAKQKVEDAKGYIEQIPEAVDVSELLERVKVVQAEGKAVKVQIEQLEEKMQQNRCKVEEKKSAYFDARAKYSILEDDAKLAAGGKCPTCGQDMHRNDELMSRLEESKDVYEKTKAAFESISGQLDKLEAKARAKRTQHSDKLEGYRSELQDLKHRINASKANQNVRDQANQRLWDAEREVEDVRKEFADHKSRTEQVEVELEKMKLVERVLSTKGVRSYVLGKTLSGIEEVANAWLPRIASGDLRIKLSPYSEKKTGGVSDSISLEVIGAGGGHGYKGASGGERRRIDVAILLALSEIASASAGREGATLWFDEVFDALDDEGVESVCQVLQELGQEQCVVVITHSEQMIKALHGAERVHLG